MKQEIDKLQKRFIEVTETEEEKTVRIMKEVEELTAQKLEAVENDDFDKVFLCGWPVMHVFSSGCKYLST